MTDLGTRGLTTGPQAADQARRHAAQRAAAPRSLSPSIPQSPNPSAFTLIELLVVIVVIGILIAAIGLVGSKAHHNQKIRVTETTMKTVKQAIDQFATQNPLGAIYNRRDAATFGPYPPYQLANPKSGVAWALEPNHPFFQYAFRPQVLTQRLARDISGIAEGSPVSFNPTSWARLVTDPDTDDIRALYAYLKLYASSELTQVPSTTIKPLSNTPEYVNPTGTGPLPGVAGGTWLDVFGIHDAWGVPLDYFLYVKLEWSMLANGASAWRVTDRLPVLRSRGISREEYEAELKGTDEYDPDRWIFSDPFPSPAADPGNTTFRKSGVISTPWNTTKNGWARAVGAGDLDPNLPADHPGLFGYVP
jgi:prepilin-type N-terminal cleavage/methylation domain-containing protein